MLALLNEQIEKRSKQAQEEYLRTVPKKLRKESLVMMPDIFGGFSNLSAVVMTSSPYISCIFFMYSNKSVIIHLTFLQYRRMQNHLHHIYLLYNLIVLTYRV